MNLIPQRWTYDGIPFGVGRPELVGTLPEFRNRGLIRRQFAEVHRWSAARGDQLQAISGIPYYSRQFGYEMALDPDGRRDGFEMNVPLLGPGKSEPYIFRSAVLADVPFRSELYNHARLHYPVACARDAAIWRCELEGRSEPARSLFLIIERGGDPIGFLRHWPRLDTTDLACQLCESKPRVSWLETAPSVVRYLWKTGQEYAGRDHRRCTTFIFAHGQHHPIYKGLKERLPGIRKSYAWYLWVPDLAGFLRHIGPALEKRRVRSLACGYTGEKTMSFYRGGLRVEFQQRRLTEVEPWVPSGGRHEVHIAFPGLAFLQLLFGYRSLAELRQSFPDCWWDSNETRVLFDALSPAHPSQIYALA